MNTSPPEAVSIAEILPPEAVVVPLRAESKQESIDMLIDLLAEHGHITDANEMKHVVWERENHEELPWVLRRVHGALPSTPQPPPRRRRGRPPPPPSPRPPPPPPPPPHRRRRRVLPNLFPDSM